MIDKKIPNYKKIDHACFMGSASHKIVTDGLKSLHRCGICKRWWFPVESDPQAKWLRVRWFNFIMRRKIRNVERKNR